MNSQDAYIILIRVFYPRCVRRGVNVFPKNSNRYYYNKTLCKSLKWMTLNIDASEKLYRA